MIGKPKFKVNDTVSFKIKDETITGQVYIVDEWGTLGDDSDVSYDVMAKSKDYPDGCLFKHIREDHLL